jgi:hypothetical protein
VDTSVPASCLLSRSCLAFVFYSCYKLIPKLILLIPYIIFTASRIIHQMNIIGFQTVHNFNNTDFVRINISLRPFRVTVVSLARNKHYIHVYESVSIAFQRTERMRRITSSSVACLALPYFSMLTSHKARCGKEVTEYKMCVMILCTRFVWKISHFKKDSAKYCNKCI